MRAVTLTDWVVETHLGLRDTVRFLRVELIGVVEAQSGW